MSLASLLSPSLALRLRKSAWKVHVAAGVATGAFLGVTILTGVILLFTEPANLRQNPRLSTRLAPPDAAPLAPVLADLARQHPGYALTSVRLPTAPDRAWMAFLRHPVTDDRRIADIDPRTATVIGVRDYRSTWFRRLLDLHYQFLIDRWGQLLGLIVAASLVGLSLSGFWIYRRAFQRLFRLPRLRGRVSRPRLAAFHAWTGTWTLAFSFLWGVTGLVWMVEMLPLTLKPASRALTPADPRVLAALPDTRPLIASGAAVFPDAELINLLPPAPGSATPQVRLRYLFRENWPWEKFGEVRFDARTGALTHINPPRAASTRAKLDSTVAALHSGNLGSRATLALSAAGAAALLLLPVTGLASWALRRRVPSPSR